MTTSKLTPVKATPKSVGKPFPKGVSGNPKGRPKGLQGVFKEAVKGELKGLIDQTIQMAKAGDMQAMAIVLNKAIATPRTETYIQEPFAIDDTLPKKVEQTLNLMFDGKLPIELTGEILKAVDVYTKMQQSSTTISGELIVKNFDTPVLIEGHGVTITEPKVDE